MMAADSHHVTGSRGVMQPDVRSHRGRDVDRLVGSVRSLSTGTLRGAGASSADDDDEGSSNRGSVVPPILGQDEAKINHHFEVVSQMTKPAELYEVLIVKTKPSPAETGQFLDLRGERLRVAEDIRPEDALIEVNGQRSNTMMHQMLMTCKDKALELRILRYKRFDFCWKQRECWGSALHIAALHRDGADEVDNLFDLKADVNEWCIFLSRGNRGRAQAIHLAAGRGYTANIEALQGHAGFDVEARTELLLKESRDAKEETWVKNVTALHEACLFECGAAIETLLALRADPNATNLAGHSPLHVAARQGAVEVARLLVSAGAGLHLREKKWENTPLMTAVDFGRFPHRKLHLLSSKCFDDVLMVAKLCPAAASELMKDRKREVHRSWGDAIRKERPDKNKWIDLMRFAPQAGEDVLEALTEQPKVQNEYHHPLPRRAALPSSRTFNCNYCPSTVWEWDDSAASPETLQWQKCLAPGIEDMAFIPAVGTAKNVPSIASGTGNGSPTVSSRRHHELVPVKVQRVSIPGLLSPSVLHALANTDHHHVFAKLQIQALLDFAWSRLVKRHYYLHLVIVVLELCVLAGCVISPPERELPARAVWCFLAVSAFREFVLELSEFNSSMLVFKDPLMYILSLTNMADFVSILVLLILIWQTRAHHDLRLQAHPVKLAFVVFSRWIKLLYAFRAFPFAGQKILPILNSFVPMGGIFLVTMILFVGFLHAFLSLELARDSPELTSVVVNTFRLLLLGDGDGANMVLQLGGLDEGGNLVTQMFLVVAVFVFCICILNLFIAVHGEAYDVAQERAQTGFYQERAAICLQCLLRPHWPPSCCRRRASQFGRRFRVRVSAETGINESADEQAEELPLDMSPLKFQWPMVVACTVVLASLPLALACLLSLEWHPVWASAALVVGIMVADMILMQRPWELSCDGQDRNYLWYCSRADYDEGRIWPSEKGFESDDLSGRLAGLKRDGLLRHRRLSQDIESLRRSVDDRIDFLQNDLEQVGSRLTRLDELLDEVLAEVLETGHLDLSGDLPEPEQQASSLGSQKAPQGEGGSPGSAGAARGAPSQATSPSTSVASRVLRVKVGAASLPPVLE
eukprot:TRINITY_DN19836_c1_g2_i5.p1 TRINITY_DN19836_c1_g2~~TRINITY_DN19836_c1_g2_i5.p1  ORF type:complete len:1093 (-),score=196.81 TRINITY_DN19836_c1_g2_i5:409-3687(-)